MNMKIQAVVIPPYIYYSLSTQKTLWEENVTLGELTPVNMKNCGSHNLRKHRCINDSDKFIILDISLKFGSLDKMRIASSDPKDNLGRSGKGLITSMGIKTNVRSKKYKRSRYAITNVCT